MKIGIIIGSIREGRVGENIANWVAEQAAQRSDATFEIIDLKELDLPLFSGPMPPMMLNKEYGDAKVQAFSEIIDSCDGFIFVTPEYNGGIPGAFKNAIDHLASEWNNKPVGLVGYSFGGGLGSMSQWRAILPVLKAQPTESQVSINLRTDIVDGQLNATEQQVADLATMFDQVIGSAA